MTRRDLKRWTATALMLATRRRPAPLADLETLHLRPDVEHFNDSSYFFGSDGRGLAIATRLAFRTAKPDEAWLELRLPGSPALSLAGEVGPRDPEGGFGLGALRFRCLAAGERWSLTYDGPMTGADGEHHLAIDLVFDGISPVIDFARVADPTAVARAMAAREWTRELFERMKEVRKVHYEQGGRLRGTITLDEEPREVDVPAVRDHSYGRRVWSQWVRHLWLLGALDDGSFLNLSMVLYDFIDPLRAGWRWRGGPVKSIVDFAGFDHFGEASAPPRCFDVVARTADGVRERLQVRSDDAFDFVLDGGAYRIREHIARFSIGGVSGVGVAEFGWNPAPLLAE